MEKIYPVAVKQSYPVFPGAPRREWFDAADDGKDSVRTAQATDGIQHVTTQSSNKKWVDRIQSVAVSERTRSNNNWILANSSGSST